MPRFVRAVALVALALATTASAQDRVEFRPDAATFRYAEDASLVEVYLSLRAETLPFAATADGYEATVPVRLVVRPVAQGAPAGSASEPVVEETLTYTYQFADMAMVQAGQVFVEQVRLAVAPGEYELGVTVAPEGGAEVQALLDLAVPDYSAAEGTAISAIQLASDIQPAADASNPLAKSGLVIRPNPDAFFGGSNAAVRYYAEVYDPPAEGDEYTLLTFVAETEAGAALPDHQRRSTRRARPVDVVAGQLAVGDLPSGIYYLRLVALNEANEAVAEQSKRFFVINPEVERPEDVAGVMTNEETLFAAMGEEELAENVAHAFVIADNQERAEIAAVATDEDRRRFLARFWADRDEDGVPGVNQARRQFYERLRFVENRFSEFGREPYRTDRGRVYLTYGPPTEIARRIFEADAYPHEIWYYNDIPGEGRSVFVFVDRYSSNQFDLLHSDVTGEVSVPQWETEVVR